MRFLIGISCFLVLAAVKTFATKGPSKYKFRFLEYSNCTDYPDAIIKFENLNINRIGLDDYILTGMIDVTEDTYGPLYMGAKVQNCGQDINDECVHFANVIDKDICEELKIEDSEAYDLLNNTMKIPDPKCPITKQIHEIETDSVDMSKYEYVVDKGKRWKVELIFYKADKITVNSCLFLHILIEPKSKKERTRDKKKWQQKEKEEAKKKDEEKKEES